MRTAQTYLYKCVCVWGERCEYVCVYVNVNVCGEKVCEYMQVCACVNVCARVCVCVNMVCV